MFARYQNILTTYHQHIIDILSSIARTSPLFFGLSMYRADVTQHLANIIWYSRTSSNIINISRYLANVREISEHIRTYWQTSPNIIKQLANFARFLLDHRSISSTSSTYRANIIDNSRVIRECHRTLSITRALSSTSSSISRTSREHHHCFLLSSNNSRMFARYQSVLVNIIEHYTILHNIISTSHKVRALSFGFIELHQSSITRVRNQCRQTYHRHIARISSSNSRVIRELHRCFLDSSNTSRELHRTLSSISRMFAQYRNISEHISKHHRTLHNIIERRANFARFLLDHRSFHKYHRHIARISLITRELFASIIEHHL